MNKLISLFVVSIVFFWPSLVPAKEIKVTKEALSYAQELQIESNILGKTTSINVHLPGNFYDVSPDHTYPVVFAVGAHGEEFFLTLSGIVKHMSELDRMPESIVVSLNDGGYIPEVLTNGMWSSRETIGPYGEPAKYIEFLKKELFPFLQTEFRANDFRMIIGVSGSALFPLYSLTHHPDLFDYHIFTTSHDMFGMSFKPDSDMTDLMVKTLKNRPESKTALYFGVADDDIGRGNPDLDPLYQNNVTKLTNAIEQIDLPNFKGKVEVFENERHYDVYVKAMLSAIDFMFPEHRWAKKFRDLIAQPGDAMLNIENHYRELSKEYGFKVLPKANRWNSVNCLRVISRVMLGDQRYDETIRVANRWAELRPYSPLPYERIAQVHENQNDLKHAVEAIDKAIAIASQQNDYRLDVLSQYRDSLRTKLTE